MEDYKELITLLEEACMFKITEMTEESLYKVELFTQAADVIEHLVKERDEWKTLGLLANKRAEDYREMRRQRDKAIKERDAAIADLRKIAGCDFCVLENASPYSCLKKECVHGENGNSAWEWRGVQEV